MLRVEIARSIDDAGVLLLGVCGDLLDLDPSHAAANRLCDSSCLLYFGNERLLVVAHAHTAEAKEPAFLEALAAFSATLTSIAL